MRDYSSWCIRNTYDIMRAEVKRMNNTKDVSIGSRIMILRTSRGYTREYLSEKVDISAKFLYEIETNKKGFSATTLAKLANALEVSMDFIMTGKGSRKYDEEIATTLEMFKPHDLKAVESLLKIAYELANGK